MRDLKTPSWCRGESLRSTFSQVSVGGGCCRKNSNHLEIEIRMLQVGSSLSEKQNDAKIEEFIFCFAHFCPFLANCITTSNGNVIFSVALFSCTNDFCGFGSAKNPPNVWWKPCLRKSCVLTIVVQTNSRTNQIVFLGANSWFFGWCWLSTLTPPNHLVHYVWLPMETPYDRGTPLYL